MGDKKSAEPAAEGGQAGKQQALGALALLLMVGTGFVLLLAFDHWIMPPHRPDFGKNSSAFDALIDSRLVIGLIRLLAIIVAVYVVGSVVAHMRAGRWIVAFGGASAERTDRDRESLQRRLKEAEDKYATLAGEYEHVVTLLAESVKEEQDAPEAGGGQS